MYSLSDRDLLDIAIVCQLADNGSPAADRWKDLAKRATDELERRRYKKRLTCGICGEEGFTRKSCGKTHNKVREAS